MKIRNSKVRNVRFRPNTPTPVGAPHPKGQGRTNAHLLIALWIAILTPPSISYAGPFVDGGHAVGEMSAWATAVQEVVRGPLDIATPELGQASWGLPEYALGAASGDSADTVSLGDGGRITVFLESGISNGPGNDFAVFENGFFDSFGLFAEFAFVEVSSSGDEFARFEAETVNPFPVLSFDSVDPTDYFGLAGRHSTLLGTGFDLADLAFHPLVQTGALDLMNVRVVRLIDVIGDGSNLDVMGNPIYDPYATPFVTGGFDLDAVGVVHVPEPRVAIGIAVGLLGLAVAFATRRRRGAPARRARVTALGLGTTLLIGTPAFALTATFEDLGLGAETFENGASFSGSFTSGGIEFENTHFPSFNGFNGFAASTITDNTTPGFGNQYGNITGGGAGGSEAFGIYFSGGRVILPTEQVVLGAEFTNTTYAALSMLNGDSFAKMFGGVTGDDPDFFRLLIEGIDSVGNSTGSRELLLADYRFADNSLDYILNEWTFLDLSGLGAVKELAFSFESSDVGSFGINTPTYFAIDNLTTIPEPGSALLIGLGLAALARRTAPHGRR